MSRRSAWSAGIRYGWLEQAQDQESGPLGSLAGTVLVRTDKMQGIRIDPQNRTARVQAGVVWLDVVQAAAAHGLAGLAAEAVAWHKSGS